MKIIEKVMTHDGEIHDDIISAKFYLDVMYQNLLSLMVTGLNNLDQVGKYDYITNHLEQFNKLKIIHDDWLVLENFDSKKEKL